MHGVQVILAEPYIFISNQSPNILHNLEPRTQTAKRPQATVDTKKHFAYHQKYTL